MGESRERQAYCEQAPCIRPSAAPRPPIVQPPLCRSARAPQPTAPRASSGTPTTSIRRRSCTECSLGLTRLPQILSCLSTQSPTLNSSLPESRDSHSTQPPHFCVRIGCCVLCPELKRARKWAAVAHTPWRSPPSRSTPWDHHRTDWRQRDRGTSNKRVQANPPQRLGLALQQEQARAGRAFSV